MADLVIRGMEIPTVCIDNGWYGNCPMDRSWCARRFAPKDSTNESVHKEQWNKLPSWCPLAPLPEGHGDLIDRDAFRAENGLNAKCEHCPTNTYECQRDMIHTKMEFCEMLDDATVIVPAEGGGEDGA